MAQRRHWDHNVKKLVTNSAVDHFLKDIVSAYKKHNMSISHEDTHGGFIVEPLSDMNVEWLREASINIPENKESPSRREE